jgi:hypothetical protein
MTTPEKMRYALVVVVMKNEMAKAELQAAPSTFFYYSIQGTAGGGPEALMAIDDYLLFRN